MHFGSNWYPNPTWGDVNRSNLDEFGTTNQEEIERMKEYGQRKVDKESEIKANQMAQGKLDEMKEELRVEITRDTIKTFLSVKGNEIKRFSPWITERVLADGGELFPSDFIPETIEGDPIHDDVWLYYNDIENKWLLRTKAAGAHKLISRFCVIVVLIVNAYASGCCRALVVFLKGFTKPLIFWEGIISSTELRKQTQFQQKGLTVRNRDYYYESFIRSLSMCKNVFFLTIPSHAGWNVTPDGRRVFVSSSDMIPHLQDLFENMEG